MTGSALSSIELLSYGLSSASARVLAPSELEALIQAQEREQRQGIDTEVGHWMDESIHTPLRNTGDLTILDTLGEEDGALAELMGEAP